MKNKTSLVLRKETKFDKIRESLLSLFFGEDYYLIQRMEDLITPKRIKEGINTKNIIVPKEIGKRKKSI